MKDKKREIEKNKEKKYANLLFFVKKISHGPHPKKKILRHQKKTWITKPPRKREELYNNKQKKEKKKVQNDYETYLFVTGRGGNSLFLLLSYLLERKKKVKNIPGF